MKKKAKILFTIWLINLFIPNLIIGKVILSDSSTVRMVQMSPQDDIYQSIKTAVNNAEKSIDVAVYIFEYKPIADLLIKAKDEGIKVRVVTDERTLAFSARDSSKKHDYNLISYLMENDIDIRIYDPSLGNLSGGIMHQKYIVIDNKKVFFGSYNFKIEAQEKNQENFVLIESKTLGKLFTENFRDIFENLSYNFTSINEADLAYKKSYYYSVIKLNLKYFLISYSLLITIILGILWLKNGNIFSKERIS